jgi:predicted hotdog family 3-hydroxylacyl-ACP dehydratase
MTQYGPIEHADLERLVPHEGTMFFLDRMISWDLESGAFLAEAVANESCPFFDWEKRGVPVWVAFEYMAQGIAALSGLRHQKNGEGPKIGLIMGIRNFVALEPFFSSSMKIDIEAREIHRDGSVVAFSCRVGSCGRQIATAIVNAFETEKKA